MHSFADLTSYSLPDELLLGNLRSTMEFARVELLGEGSSSSVYKANETKKRRCVAMKYLKKTQMASTLTKEIFREITILKSLNHENVIKLHEVVIDTDINNLCLILDYCPYSLDKYIDHYPRSIPHSQIKCIARQLFKGLDYLHKNYVIHRDLKTTNLMISAKMELKIIDFGLSRRYSLQNMAMSPNVITRWYQPPEILLLAPSYGPEVDMWSAGCILAELFNKAPILPGESDLQQINLIIGLIGTPTAKIWPGYSKCKIPKHICLRAQPYNKIVEQCHEWGCTDATQILSSLLVYDPETRIKANACVHHDWLEMAPFPAKSIEIPAEVPGTRRVVRGPMIINLPQ